MWQTWTRAKTFSQLPSQVYDPSGEEWNVPFGSIAQWMFDTAVTWFGITIENALEERVKVNLGKEVQYKPKYTLARLLNPMFKLPKPVQVPEESPNPWAPLLSLIGKKNSGVRRWKYTGPEADTSSPEKVH